MRYALFMGDRYYPAGGWRDLKGRSDSKEAILAIKDALVETDTFVYGWWHIVDWQEGKIIEQGQISDD